MDDIEDVVTHFLVHVNLTHRTLTGNDIVSRYHGPKTVDGVLVLQPFQHLALFLAAGIAEAQPDQKPVELRFRQWEGPFVIDRVLRGHHQKRGIQQIRLAVHRHTPLGHGFQQGGLSTRCRPVDFVGQDDLGEQRPRPKLELGGLRIEDGGSRNIVGQKVGCALHSFEDAADAVGQ